jgi:hypothetical protein
MHAPDGGRQGHLAAKRAGDPQSRAVLHAGAAQVVGWQAGHNFKHHSPLSHKSAFAPALVTSPGKTVDTPPTVPRVHLSFCRQAPTMSPAKNMRRMVLVRQALSPLFQRKSTIVAC